MRQQLVSEVANLRKSLYARASIAVTDADDLSVEDRKRWLESVANPPREGNEAIVFLIPRRTIETWIWYLAGNAVDEEQKYKAKDGGPVRGEVSSEVKKRFADYIQTGQVPFSDCPASLEDAREEFGRIRP